MFLNRPYTARELSHLLDPSFNRETDRCLRIYNAQKLIQQVPPDAYAIIWDNFSELQTKVTNRNMLIRHIHENFFRAKNLTIILSRFESNIASDMFHEIKKLGGIYYCKTRYFDSKKQKYILDLVIYDIVRGVGG